MGRKHQNRRGKVGRRARARKAKNSETAEQMLGLVGGKFDAPPKSGDDSVISSKKHSKHPVLEETAPVEAQAAPKISASASKQRHEEMKRRGLDRKKLLQQISIKKPEISKISKIPKLSKLTKPETVIGNSEKPEFGETVHGPSEKIAKLGKLLAAKLRK